MRWISSTPSRASSRATERLTADTVVLDGEFQGEYPSMWWGQSPIVKTAAEALRRKDGSIINMATVASSVTAVPNRAAYTISKAAVVGLTLPMARDLARSGVRVMTIAPGIFETPMLMGMPPEVQDALGKMVSMLQVPAEAVWDRIPGITDGDLLRGVQIEDSPAKAAARTEIEAVSREALAEVPSGEPISDGVVVEAFSFCSHFSIASRTARCRPLIGRSYFDGSRAYSARFRADCSRA